MFPLPPPPTASCAASSQQLKQIGTTRGARDQQHLLPLELAPHSSKRQLGGYSKLHQPPRTSPVIWCFAIICMILSVLLILFGIATLIVFLNIKPRTPVFDTPAASLHVVYMDSPQFLNSDFTFLANFSNPNRKLDIRFEYLKVELYSLDTLISAITIPPFIQRRRETLLVPVQMTSSLVYLPPNHAVELQRQVQNNRVVYHIIGTFRVRVSLGLVHVSYWLHSRCQLELTSPPTGVLIAHGCTTKR